MIFLDVTQKEENLLKLLKNKEVIKKDNSECFVVTNVNVKEHEIGNFKVHITVSKHNEHWDITADAFDQEFKIRE